MRSHKLLRWLAMGVLLALPSMAYAQEATLTGTVRDATGGALPGVTIRAVHEASGNAFDTVTDPTGDYRIPARVGTYRLTAALSGFAPVERTVTLLVGQVAVVNLQMVVAGVRETVTVTGEAPLLDVTESKLGGNIDPRQVEALPVNGRNWVDLVVLAPGARVNAVTDQPSDIGATGSSSARDRGDFELNVDGQQITMMMGFGAPQPRISRDAIAEFEFVSSRFDALQGRSTAMQVNVITKSGTNKPSGTFAGYFRDDKYIARDFVANRVLPYHDQQLSGTFGGPIIKDRLHFFANYEDEREPRTLVWTTPFPRYNQVRERARTEKKGGGRVDAQFSERVRLSVRLGSWRSGVPDPSGSAGVATGTAAPPGESIQQNSANQVLAALTQVLSHRVVNEVKVGYAGLIQDTSQAVLNPEFQVGADGPSLSFGGGFSISSPRVFYEGRLNGEYQPQKVYNVRDDFTASFNKGGRHTLKLGAEYLHQYTLDRRDSIDGALDLTRAVKGTTNPPSDLETLIPNLYDASTWNLAALNPFAVRFTQTFGGPFGSSVTRHTIGAWVQDDWTPTPRLSLNLGVRYDAELNAFSNHIVLMPFLTGSNQHNDLNNVGPRVGFSLSVNDRTQVRGGAGLYYGTIIAGHQGFLIQDSLSITQTFDGRADFTTNPWNGPTPTLQQVQQRLCSTANVTGCLRKDAGTLGPVFAPGFKMPHSDQVSIGLQRQLGSSIGIDADYVYIGTRDAPRDQPVNVTYNPATGANYPSTDLTRKPFSEWNYVSLTTNGMRSNYHALQTAVTKRFRGRWQASGTYTLSKFSDANPLPVQWDGSAFVPVPFPTAPDLGGEYTLAVGDQRHRAVMNGVADLPYGFQVSGLYLFGSGQRVQTRWGTDVRQLGGLRPNELRLRPDGTIVPRNSFVGKRVQRMDLRLVKRFSLPGGARIEGSLELFNVLNHKNFGAYVPNESAVNYLAPLQSTAVGYAPRTLQMGFRVQF